jgi:hypothetical protein
VTFIIIIIIVIVIADKSVLAPNGVTVRTHSDVDPRLRDAVIWAPDKQMSVFLLKWEIMRISDCEYVIYADLDIVLLTPHQLLRCVTPASTIMPHAIRETIRR